MLNSPGALNAGQYGPEAVLGQTGTPYTGGPITVYDSDGTTAATLYTDHTKATTAANPLNTDSYGNLTFFAAPGVYVLAFTIGGVATTLTVEVKPYYTDGAWNVVVDTGSVTALSGDSHLVNATGAAYTVTLPAPALGARVRVMKTDASTNAVTVSTPSGIINGLGLGSGATSVVLRGQGAAIDLMADGTNWHVLSGGSQFSEINGAFTANVPIVKAGTVTGTSYTTGGVAVAFAAAFPGAFDGVVATPLNSSSAGQCQVISPSVSGFTVALFTTAGVQLGSGVAYAFYYIAVGS